MQFLRLYIIDDFETANAVEKQIISAEKMRFPCDKNATKMR